MKAVNGNACYLETYYEVVDYITRQLVDDDPTGKIALTAVMEGRGGMYTLAEYWADEFEAVNSSREWDGEFYDEIEEFCNKKNAE